MLSCLALARAEVPTYDPADALALVDGLAWAWSDRRLERWRDDAATAAGPFAAAVRAPDRDGLAAFAGATVYAVEARLFDQGTPVVGGRAAIVWTNRSSEPVGALVLRYYPAAEGVRAQAPGTHAAVLEAWVEGRPARLEAEGSLVEVRLPERVPPRGSVRVLLQFFAEVPAFDPQRTTVRALPSGRQGVFGTADGVVSLGHWLPVVAPSADDGRFLADPLRDHTEHAVYDPALFHVALELDPGYAVASTGVEVHRADGGRRTWVGVAAAREFAIVLVPDAAVAETEVGGTRLRVVHPRAEPAMGHHLLDAAHQSFRLYAERWGRLASAEVDVVEGPLAAVLGVEHPELVVVDASHKGVPYHRSHDHEWTVAHELAHQWWAMEVGTEAGRAPWIDEGLASWAADRYLEDRYGADAVAVRHEIEIVEPTAALRDAGLADVPADLGAWKYDVRQYGAVVYGRASLFFARVREALGDEATDRALAALHARFRYRFADDVDVLGVLREHAPDPTVVDALHRRWIAEGHGYEDLLGSP